jgi:multicomponent Na+:H+ antiporter subunit D
MLALPAAGFVELLAAGHGTYYAFTVSGYAIAPVRIDSLSLVFGYIFYIAAFLSVIYALHVKDGVQHAAALVYAGAAIGGVFAGDLITLFVYWELTAVSSVFLIWASRTRRAYRAGVRYLIVQVGSGVLLLGGSVFLVQETGSIAFDKMGLVGIGPTLIFIAFGVKCAFPFLHNWLQDAYPEATVTGTVFLSAFTTKLAVYALARGFPGIPIFYAVIENDLRRVLAYSLNNQLGFMVVGIGIGTPLALNGTASHAFAHIIYKALLFMAMGAVLFRTGTIKGTELGGLYKSMPWTCAFCIVGAASISAFPLTSGFISKSLILSGAQHEGLIVTWIVLLFASAGVFHHSGIKIPYFAFFQHDSGMRCREAPLNMLAAMAVAAALCIGIGIFPGILYAILPYPVDFVPYTPSHVITQLQLLLLSALAFAVLMRTGLYPPEQRAVNLDFDWTYRKALPWAARAFVRHGGAVWHASMLSVTSRLERFFVELARYHGPEGVFARTWPTGVTVLWVAILLAAYLVIYSI